ncbi:hypothetical protein DEA98_17085 [Brucella pseudogrignonensis]|nr:hypothetical protein [Brucella pseudogrignonensis]
MSAQTSDAEPFKSLVALSNEIELRDGLADVVVMGGFPYVDSDDVGSSVLVTGNNEEAMKRPIATWPKSYGNSEKQSLARHLHLKKQQQRSMRVQSKAASSLATQAIILGRVG